MPTIYAFCDEKTCNLKEKTDNGFLYLERTVNRAISRKKNENRSTTFRMFVPTLHVHKSDIR